MDTTQPYRHAPDSGRIRLDASPASVYALGDLIRRTEEELLELFSRGLVNGTTHTCIGQELTQLSVVRALEDCDYIFSNHRNHGHLLAYCGDVKGLIAEVTGREGGLCGGRGGSQHLAVGRFFSNGVQGGLTGAAVGCALGARLEGAPALSVVFLGDGTLGEGILYEAMNLASIWSLPVLFVIENNSIAQTTPASWTVSGDIGARGAAFGLSVKELDDSSNSFIEDVAGFVETVRAENRPGLLVVKTERLGPHSKGDDLRPDGHMQAIRARDPLKAWRRKLPPQDADEIDAINERLVREASDEVLNRALSRPARHLDRVTVKNPAPHSCSLGEIAETGTIRDSLNQALRRLLESDDRVVLLGEDLHDPYGGAFKVTSGLSTDFPERVLSTPISEAGITGTAIGLALAGKRPVLEIMFADFVSLCVDQLYNQATKLGRIHGGAPLPLVLRTPSGGYRGYGPTHSQSPEALIAAIPGMTVVSPNRRISAGALLTNAVRHAPGPTLFAEHKLLYGERAEAADYQLLPPSEEGALDAAFPTAARLREEPDIVIVSYGWILSLVEEAAGYLEEEEELSVEILAPTLLAPLSISPLAARVGRCERLLVVEEGPARMGVGSELVSRLAECGVVAKVRVLGAQDGFIPAARHLEQQALPTVETIVAAAAALFE